MNFVHLDGYSLSTLCFIRISRVVLDEFRSKGQRVDHVVDLYGTKCILRTRIIQMEPNAK